MSHLHASDPDTNQASPAQVVGVAGLGLLGRGIATCLLAHGFQVIAFDVQETTHAQARKHIAEALGQLVERGHFPKEVLATWESRYRLTASLSEFSEYHGGA